MVEIRFGLFAYGGDSVWSFLIAVENRFGLSYLRFPPVRRLDLPSRAPGLHALLPSDTKLLLTKNYF